jgi:hypothetical protein
MLNSCGSQIRDLLVRAGIGDARECVMTMILMLM